MPTGERPEKWELVPGTRLTWTHGPLNKTEIEITDASDEWRSWKYIGRKAGRRGRGRASSERSRVDELIAHTVLSRLARSLRNRTQPIPGVRAIKPPTLVTYDDDREIEHKLPTADEAAQRIHGVVSEAWPKRKPEPEPEPEPEPPAQEEEEVAEQKRPYQKQPGRKQRNPRRSLRSLLDEMQRRRITIDAIEEHCRHAGVGGTCDRLGWTQSQLFRVRTHFGTQPDRSESLSRAAEIGQHKLPNDFSLFGNWVRPMVRPENQPQEDPTVTQSNRAKAAEALDAVTDEEVLAVARARLRALRAERAALAEEIEPEVDAYREKLLNERGGDIADKIARMELTIETLGGEQ
jgi:hypothetical protein